MLHSRLIRFETMMRWAAVVALAGSLSLWGLDPTVSLSQYAKKQWQVEDGLPQNYITWISQTEKGYLLVGTAGGAAKFDGMRFTPLVLDASTGISREWINIVQPGPNEDTIWVATRDSGFYRLGTKHWPLRFSALIVDRSGNPIGLGPGLFRYREGDLQIEEEGIGAADPSWTGLAEVPASNGGGLLIASSRGLLWKQAQKKQPVVLLAAGAAEGRTLAAVNARKPNGGFWVGTSNGLYHLQLTGTNTAASFTKVQAVRGPVVSILEDSDGIVWAGTWAYGLYRIIGDNAEPFTTTEGLPDNFVHALFEDREGNLWIGTRAGLSRWKSTPIVPFGLTEGANGQFFSTVSADEQGNVWLGTWRSGLYRLHQGSNATHVPLPRPDLRTLVRSTATAPDGSFWLADWTALHRREGANWKIFTQTELGYVPQVQSLLFDRQGHLWVGAEDGLYQHGKAPHIGLGRRRLSGHSVRALLEDSRKRIWAAAMDGLWHLAPGSDAPKQIQGLPHATVTSVSEDSSGRIWATTRANGIVRINDDGSVQVLDQRQGLPALPIYAVVDDHRGSLWLSSPAGIFAIQATLLSDLLAGKRPLVPVVAYGQDDGMRTIECQSVGFPSGIRDAQGDIWFPTVRGAVRIRPSKRSATVAPAVIVEATRTVQQSHTIRFTATRLGAPSRVEFRYRTHADDPWTYVGNERTLRFSGLPAGTHTVRIAARERGGEWGAPIEVALYQPPRWHETWAFRLAGLLVLAAALLLIYRWRMYIVRSRYAAVLSERNRIAREWHDTLLAGFSAISWQLDITRKRLGEKPDAAAQTVDVAQTMVQHYRAEARRVIWDLRHDAPEPQSLATAITSALLEMTRERGILSEVSVEGPMQPVSGELAQNLLRICQEAAANAIHHGAARRIDVCLKYNGNRLAVTVRDDGSGFDPKAVPPGHFGLQIMRERALRFGGELHVCSSEREGTTITAAIPLEAA